MSRVRLTQRRQGADMSIPYPGNVNQPDRKDPAWDQYHTFEQQVNHELPDMRHEWKDDARDDIGFGVPESNPPTVASVRVAANKAVRIAVLLLGEKVDDEVIEKQARDLMTMGSEAMDRTLERFSATQKLYAEEDEKKEDKKEEEKEEKKASRDLAQGKKSEDKVEEKVEEKTEEKEATDDKDEDDKVEEKKATDDKDEDDKVEEKKATDDKDEDDKVEEKKEAKSKKSEDKKEIPEFIQKKIDESKEKKEDKKATDDKDEDDKVEAKSKKSEDEEDEEEVVAKKSSTDMDIELQATEEDMEDDPEADAQLASVFADDGLTANEEVQPKVASKKAGIKKLGGQPKVAGTESAPVDISSIWDSAPDVSNVFK